MPIQEFNGFSNRSLRLGPEQNTFEGTDLANAESIRDSYFSSNPSKLAIYDANSSLMIRLAYTTVDGSTIKFMVRIAGDWVDYTPVVQGLPGEVASLVGVPIGEIPYKLIDGTFGGSNMRVLEDGRVLAPPGFTVESGSVTFGEAITLSEISGFLGISNHLNNREYTVVDFYTPSDAISSPPTIFHLIEPAFEFVAQSNDSTNLPDNPLIFNYTAQNTARSRALKFRTYAAMTNVRMKISLVSNGVVLKHIPSQQAWEESTGGLNWTLGDNTYSFGDTSLNLQTGDQLHFELRADNVALKGNNLGVPYFSAMIQRGQFRDVITDAVYVASDIKAKLETLVSPNKLSKTAIQDAVLSVNSQYGDVLVTTTSIGAQPLDATLTALASQVTSADGLTYSTGVDTFSQTVFTPYARTLLDDTTSAQARATLELGSIATQNAENISITGGSITGITDIAISDGGTGSSTASGARANLGLGTIATQDSNNVNITGGSVSGITDLAVSDGGTGASTASQARTNLGLVIGTNVQAQDAFLTSIASLGTASDKIIYTTGVDTAEETSLTPFARTLIDDIDGATMRGTLGLGSIATQNANSVAITGGSITGISDILIADGGTGASTALGARTNLGIITGTYTPTLFNTTNVAASQAYQFQYMQIGDMVQVTGKVDIDPTKNNQSTVLGVSLPIASNLGAEEDCSGVGACPDVAGQVGAILGDITNDRATIQFVSGSSLNHKMMISFMYQVI